MNKRSEDKLDGVFKTEGLNVTIIFSVFIPCTMMRFSDVSEKLAPQIFMVKI
jgi:hypothetical protein